MRRGSTRVAAGADGPSGTYRRAVRRSCVVGVLSLLVVAGLGYVVSDMLAEREALRDATIRARGIAHGVAAPLVTEEAREGEPTSLRRMGEVLHARIAEGGVSHVVLWDEDGRIIWMSRGDLAGQTFDLEGDARAALTAQRAVAHLPDATPVHAAGLYAEPGQLEVYVGTIGADGQPFLFEAYLPADRIEQDRAAVLPKLLAMGIGSALLLLALTVPFALRLARRVDDEQRARAEALQRSVLSWRHQRLQLAQDLHDGVIQDVAALGMGLTLLEGRALDADMSAEVLGRLQESARRGEAALRSLVLDLTPRELEARGLNDALVDLARQHGRNGLDITLVQGRDLDLADGTAILAFRVVREGLRNVVKHPRRPLPPPFQRAISYPYGRYVSRHPDASPPRPRRPPPRRRRALHHRRRLLLRLPRPLPFLPRLPPPLRPPTRPMEQAPVALAPWPRAPASGRIGSCERERVAPRDGERQRADPAPSPFTPPPSFVCFVSFVVPAPSAPPPSRSFFRVIRVFRGQLNPPYRPIC